jgi:hypothetical protein
MGNSSNESRLSQYEWTKVSVLLTVDLSRVNSCLLEDEQ